MDLKQAMTEALTDTIVEIFSSVFSEVPAVYQKKYTLPLTAEGVVATVGLAGRLEGALILVFPADCASKIVSEVFSVEAGGPSSLRHGEVSAEVSDGVGEISNIIAGGLKSRIAQTEGYDFIISLPTVVKAKGELCVAEQPKAGAVELCVVYGDLSFGLKCYYCVRQASAAAADKRQDQEIKKAQKAEKVAGVLEDFIKNGE